MTALTPAQAVVARAMKERDLQSNVMAALQHYGFRATHFRPARTAHGWRTPLEGDAGFPDIVALKDGRGLAIELKAQRGKLTDEQRIWLARFQETGFEAWCWRPQDWLSGRIDEVLER